MLKKVLDEISKTESNALWVSDQSAKLGEQLEHIRRTRKGWITSVVGALEQPGGLREFFLPNEFLVAFNELGKGAWLASNHFLYQ